MKPANSGPIYASGIYPKLADAFRTHGYALAIHGSVMSDFDLIAVPWIEDASDPEIVIEDIEAKFCIARWGADKAPAFRPHGRLAYCVHLSFGDCRLDISFTPRLSGSIRSECCHRLIEPLERFCPQCGQECRIERATSSAGEQR